jgi:hypothetical protein
MKIPYPVFETFKGLGPKFRILFVKVVTTSANLADSADETHSIAKRSGSIPASVITVLIISVLASAL